MRITKVTTKTGDAEQTGLGMGNVFLKIVLEFMRWVR